MLSACTAGSDALEDSNDVWKVLIYDASGRDIIAPLLQVADLRAAGVTLHMMLHASRQPIPDVPAVYFVEPTKENMTRIASDSAKGFYASLWINFTDSISRDLLESFADMVATISNPSPFAGRIARVYDMYTSFLSLEDSLFHLNLPGSYVKLNARNVTDSEVEAVIKSIVDRLFCLIVTLGVAPVIRAQRGGPASHVARMLEQRIREHLISSNNVFSETISFAAAPAERPLLVIVDRSIDMSVMLHHTWTYQALAHDTLGMKLNRVTVPHKDENNPMGEIRKRAFDLDKSDSFWAKNAGLPFPMVADAVENALQAYQQEVADLNRSAGAIGGEPIDPATATLKEGANANKLAAAISSIPALSKKKRTIDLHTNIATAILDQIKDRGLDGFFQVEEELLMRPSTFDVERILALLKNMKGTPTDKLRLFLVYYLCVDNASESDLKRCVEALETAGCSDLRAYAYLQSIRAFTKKVSAIPKAPLTASTSIGSGYALSVLDTLSQVASNVNKLIISADKAFAAARIVQTLMDRKGDASILEEYETLDPKAPKGTAPPTVTRPCKEAVLFVVGPGNYIEFQNCQDQVCSRVVQDGKNTQFVPNGKTVIYGATELCSGVEFVEQLQRSGAASATP
ncbi:Sec1 [Gracilaria domingensis]|nr:Sec1 [Gracilaria domingensis]